MAKSSLEKTWLFYEIGRCYLELDKGEAARNYGEKSLQSADEEGDVEWQLHASVLVAQAQGKDVTTIFALRTDGSLSVQLLTYLSFNNQSNRSDQDLSQETCLINTCSSLYLGLK